jgi:hypothetical protein
MSLKQVQTRVRPVVYKVHPGTYYAMVGTALNSHKQVHPSMYHLVLLVGILTKLAFQRNAQDIQCNGLYGHVIAESTLNIPLTYHFV